MGTVKHLDCLGRNGLYVLCNLRNLRIDPRCKLSFLNCE
jgi:hypothetical protein